MNTLNQSVLARLDSTQQNVAVHEKEMGDFREWVKRDLAHLASVLGTELPSDMPRAANSYDVEDSPKLKRGY